jgi:hypothetical protein
MDIPCQLDEVSYFVPFSYYPFQLLCLHAYSVLVRNPLQVMGIMNRLQAKQPRNRGSIHERNKETLSSPKHSDRRKPTQTPVQRTLGGIFPGRNGRVVNVLTSVIN